MTIKFQRMGQNQLYLKGLTEDQALVDCKQRKNKKLKPQVTLINPWIQNTIVYPVEVNLEYDCMDKFNFLKNFNNIQEELESKEYAIKLGGNSVSTSPVLTKPNLVGLNEPVGRQVVLIVEDSQFMVEIIKNLLQQQGVDLEVGYNGQEACEKVEEYLKMKKMFDIILMDLYMPIMDGYEASTQIRKLEAKYGISESEKHFICGHSSEANRQVEIKCLKNGMDDIIAKPMNVKTLKRMLYDHDRRRKQRGLSYYANSTVSPMSEHQSAFKLFRNTSERKIHTQL